jgi:DNA-binding NarL/FixJ family response regulator
LYNEYYRRIGIDHAIAVPLFVDKGLLVSFVLNRRGRDFSDRECALLDLVRGPLSALYRQAQLVTQQRRGFAGLPITRREAEVLTWLASGKTDREIAQIVGANMRTVQKHLQHIYEKLGVETRTAAVMRAMEMKLRLPSAELLDLP